MTMAPQDIFPHLAGWVANLDDVFPGKQVKPYFAQWEVGHILSLVVLGGSSILLNLRLMGVGLTDEPPRELHRNLGRWVWIGAVSIVVTGLLIGSSNAERLYTSGAFSAKMVGLAAALILTFGVTLPTARADGVMSVGSRLAAIAGLAVFAFALWVFLSAKLANPGLWHVITAGALVALYATRKLTRIVFAALLVALIIAQQYVTHVVYKFDDYASLDPANKAFAWAFVALILGAFAVQAVASGRAEKGAAFVKLMALAGILVWVMTAAAGRWLAFA
jgi:hypothetical protein